MSKRKVVTPTCMYCKDLVELDGSHAQNESTGAYCHITCFMEHEPRGREIVERAKQLVVAELERAQGKRVLH